MLDVDANAGSARKERYLPSVAKIDAAVLSALP